MISTNLTSHLSNCCVSMTQISIFCVDFCEKVAIIVPIHLYFAAQPQRYAFTRQGRMYEDTHGIATTKSVHTYTLMQLHSQYFRRIFMKII
jgi:hypothetical protein